MTKAAEYDVHALTRVVAHHRDRLRLLYVRERHIRGHACA
jgi:hypothetical protein